MGRDSQGDQGGTFRKEGSKLINNGVLEARRRKSFHKDRNLF